VRVNKGMNDPRRVNLKVAVIEKNDNLLRLWSFALYGFAVVIAVLLVQLRISAILGVF
jgi:hypothetical protein